jgi:capsular polysaccharide biosynthesis protein
LDLWTAIKIVVRRWFVVLPLVLISLAVAFRVSAAVEPTYTATGSTLFVSPAQGGNNPFTNFNNAVNIMAKAIVEIAGGDEFQRSVREDGAQASYSVDVGADAPLLRVTATSDEPEKVLETIALVLESVDNELAATQQETGAPPSTFITTTVLDQPLRARQESGDRTRAFVGVLAIGVAAAVSSAFLLESFLAGRREALHLARPPRRGRRTEAA